MQAQERNNSDDDYYFDDDSDEEQQQAKGKDTKPKVVLPTLITEQLLRLASGEAELSRAVTLDLHDRDIHVLQRLELCPNLRTLDLSFNKVAVLQGLHNLVQLRELKLYDNALGALGHGLHGLSALNTLDLSSNRLTKLEGLQSLRGLRVLRLAYNQLSSLEGLGKPTALEELDLTGNSLSELSGLGPLTGLTRLTLTANRLSSLAGLSRCCKLRELSAADNQLSSLAGLKGAAGTLDTLDASGNALANLDALVEGLTMLSELNLASNRLSSLGGLAAKAPLLEMLDVSCNRLSSTSAVAEWLANLPELSSLRLEGNPCCPTASSTPTTPEFDPDPTNQSNPDNPSSSRPGTTTDTKTARATAAAGSRDSHSGKGVAVHSRDSSSREGRGKDSGNGQRQGGGRSGTAGTTGLARSSSISCSGRAPPSKAVAGAVTGAVAAVKPPAEALPQGEQRRAMGEETGAMAAQSGAAGADPDPAVTVPAVAVTAAAAAPPLSVEERAQRAAGALFAALPQLDSVDDYDRADLTSPDVWSAEGAGLLEVGPFDPSTAEMDEFKRRMNVRSSAAWADAAASGGRPGTAGRSRPASARHSVLNSSLRASQQHLLRPTTPSHDSGRPGTPSGSRPGTASGRVSAMTGEFGARDIMMHTRPPSARSGASARLMTPRQYTDAVGSFRDTMQQYSSTLRAVLGDMRAGLKLSLAEAASQLHAHDGGDNRHPVTNGSSSSSTAEGSSRNSAAANADKGSSRSTEASGMLSAASGGAHPARGIGAPHLLPVMPVLPDLPASGGAAALAAAAAAATATATAGAKHGAASSSAAGNPAKAGQLGDASVSKAAHATAVGNGHTNTGVGHGDASAATATDPGMAAALREYHRLFPQQTPKHDALNPGANADNTPVRRGMHGVATVGIHAKRREAGDSQDSAVATETGGFARTSNPAVKTAAPVEPADGSSVEEASDEELIRGGDDDNDDEVREVDAASNVAVHGSVASGLSSSEGRGDEKEQIQPAAPGVGSPAADRRSQAGGACLNPKNPAVKLNLRPVSAKAASAPIPAAAAQLKPRLHAAPAGAAAMAMAGLGKAQGLGANVNRMVRGKAPGLVVTQNGRP